MRGEYLYGLLIRWEYGWHKTWAAATDFQTIATRRYKGEIFMSVYPIEPLIEALRASANPDRAAAMSAYMRDQFPFLGVPQPVRKMLIKEHSQLYGKPKSAEEILHAAQHLWNLEEREFAYVAMGLLEGGVKFFNLAHIHRIEQFIVTRSWWDTVDGLATCTVGGVMKRYPEAWAEYADRWIHSDQMWLNRTGILFQLKYKAQTNTDLLHLAIHTHIASKEFFLQKAIGWALREYAKTNPEWVREYVEQHTLMTLSRREALKKSR